MLNKEVGGGGDRERVNKPFILCPLLQDVLTEYSSGGISVRSWPEETSEFYISILRFENACSLTISEPNYE